MSKLLDVERYVLETTRGALRVTREDVHLGAKRHDDIPAGVSPFAYTIGFERAIERGDATGRATDVYTGTLVVLWRQPMDREEILEAADVVDAALLSDRTFGGLVEPDTTVALAAITQDDKSQPVAVFGIDARQPSDAAQGLMYSWVVSGQARLMSVSATNYLDALALELESVLGGTRLTNDIGDPLEEVQAGTTRFQLNRVLSQEDRDSNLTREVVTSEITVWVRLNPGESERSYTEGDMLTQTKTLLHPDFLKAGLGSAVEIPEGSEPSLTFPGDIVRQT